MTKQPEKYSVIRYLEAKRTVDDRALNLGCWTRLVDEVKSLPREYPLKVIEAGAGVGTMVERLVEWGVSRNFNYTGVDSNPDLLARALDRLAPWAGRRGWAVEEPAEGGLILRHGEAQIRLRLLAEDIFVSARPGNYDLLIAHAFLDLVDLRTALPHLLSVLRPSGLFYLTLVFDGVTVLLPEIDAALDGRIEAAYHRSMDTRTIREGGAGHSRTGRSLLEFLVKHGLPILAVGSSDWVVHPPYPGDEAYFLHHILHLMEQSLREWPDLKGRGLEKWLAIRHRQVAEGRLIYIAHQLDVLGRATKP